MILIALRPDEGCSSASLYNIPPNQSSQTQSRREQCLNLSYRRLRATYRHDGGMWWSKPTSLGAKCHNECRLCGRYMAFRWTSFDKPVSFCLSRSQICGDPHLSNGLHIGMEQCFPGYQLSKYMQFLVSDDTIMSRYCHNRSILTVHRFLS